MRALFVSVFMLAVAMPCYGVDTRTAPDVVAQSSARGMDYNTYIRLTTGMDEGELISRAGPPDSEAVENFKDDIVKSFYYMPTLANLYVTTVKLRGGRIISVDRTKRN